MIIIRVFGGLGNQLFQYAFYKTLKEYNENVYLDISDYDIHKHHNGFELEKIFNVNFDKASCKQIKRISMDKKKFLYRIIKKIFKIDIIKQYEYIEKRDVSNINIGYINGDVYFNGFWQDKKFIKKIEKDIKNELTFKESLDERNQMLINDLNDKESVSVHIRRGDYVNNKSLGGICNKEYYLKAINLIEEKINNPIFVFFSDDIEWVKDNINLNQKCIYVDWNKGEDSYKDMKLMSSCKHNIIANSTFSWWGAWLNNNKDKIVIAPKRWFNNSDNNELVLDEWIKI